MSRTSKLKVNGISTMSISYSSTLPLDFDREEAWKILSTIVDEVYPQTTKNRDLKKVKVAKLETITESFTQNQYCFSVDVIGEPAVKEKVDVEVDY